MLVFSAAVRWSTSTITKTSTSTSCSSSGSSRAALSHCPVRAQPNQGVSHTSIPWAVLNPSHLLPWGTRYPSSACSYTTSTTACDYTHIKLNVSHSYRCYVLTASDTRLAMVFMRTSTIPGDKDGCVVLKVTSFGVVLGLLPLAKVF